MRNMRLRLMFHRENIDKDQDFWNHVIWTDECKTELFGHQDRDDVQYKLNTFQEKKLSPDVKHGGGRIMDATPSSSC